MSLSELNDPSVTEMYNPVFGSIGSIGAVTFSGITAQGREGIASGGLWLDPTSKQVRYSNIPARPPFITVDSMSTNMNISGYTMLNNNTTLILNPTRDLYVRLPVTTGLEGFQLSIINVSSVSKISLCTDNYTTTLKEIPPQDQGLRLLALSSRYIFLLL